MENVDLAGRAAQTEKTGREQTVPIAEPLHSTCRISPKDDPHAPLFGRAFDSRQRDIDRHAK
jgi:hypothetical protein